MNTCITCRYPVLFTSYVLICALYDMRCKYRYTIEEWSLRKFKEETFQFCKYRYVVFDKCCLNRKFHNLNLNNAIFPGTSV
jgi:hypothetical protein